MSSARDWLALLALVALLAAGVWFVHEEGEASDVWRARGSKRSVLELEGARAADPPGAGCGE